MKSTVRILMHLNQIEMPHALCNKIIVRQMLVNNLSSLHNQILISHNFISLFYYSIGETHLSVEKKNKKGNYFHLIGFDKKHSSNHLDIQELKARLKCNKRKFELKE